MKHGIFVFNERGANSYAPPPAYEKGEQMPPLLRCGRVPLRSHEVNVLNVKVIKWLAEATRMIK